MEWIGKKLNWPQRWYVHIVVSHIAIGHPYFYHKHYPLALEAGIRIKAQLVLLQEPTAKWGIRHPGYRLIWPQEGGIKPRTLVGVMLDAKLKVEYRSDLGQNTMGDIMVLDITMDTGRKIRVVNVYDQLEKGRNTNVRPARMANWNQIMNDRTIVCGDFNSHSSKWDPSCVRERDSTFWKDWTQEYLMELGNNGQSTRDRPNGSKSIIDLTWSTPLGSPLGMWRLGKDNEDTGSDHRLIVWQTKLHTTGNPIPIGERIRWDISHMTDDEKEEAELLWLEAGESRVILNDYSFCEDIEAEAKWIEETFIQILDKKARRLRLCARSKRWWNEIIEAKRKALSRAKRRQYEEGGLERFRNAQKEMKNEIRKSKRKMWQNFLMNAQCDDVWKALEFTKPTMNIALPVLHDDIGNTAISIEEERQMLMDHAFPKPPRDDSNEYLFKPAGYYHKGITSEKVGASI
jgi:hypothetical protein